MTEKLPHGTVAWFDMVGAEIAKVATEVGLPSDLRLSVIERYIDGAELEEGLLQGLRIDVVDGALTCRAGVHNDEIADVVIKVTADTARQLNLLVSVDPQYPQVLSRAIATGDFHVCGNLGPLGSVFRQAHDAIVERTA